MDQRICHVCGKKVPRRGTREVTIDGAEWVACPKCHTELAGVVSEQVTKRRTCHGCGELLEDEGFRRVRLLGRDVWLCQDCVLHEATLKQTVLQAVSRWIRQRAEERTTCPR